MIPSPLLRMWNNSPQFSISHVLWQPIAPRAAKLSPQTISHLPPIRPLRTPPRNTCPFAPKAPPGALTPSPCTPPHFSHYRNDIQHSIREHASQAKQALLSCYLGNTFATVFQFAII